MKPVFLDSVGLIACWNRQDQWHTAAKVAYQKLHDNACKLITSSLVLWECGNAAARQPFRPRVNELRRHLIQEESLIDPTEHEIELAWIAYTRGDAGAAGIVDHVSFQLMQRLGINEAFTNDRHFNAAGFTVLF